MLCNKITLYSYTIFIVQYDNIYEIKKNKNNNNNLKTQNLITSTQSRVSNNTKIHQSKVEMQEKYNKIHQKWKKKNEREKEREITFWGGENLEKV